MSYFDGGKDLFFGCIVQFFRIAFIFEEIMPKIRKNVTICATFGPFPFPTGAIPLQKSSNDEYENKNPVSTDCPDGPDAGWLLLP
jgi:hypothetical protein